MSLTWRICHLRKLGYPCSKMRACSGTKTKSITFGDKNLWVNITYSHCRSENQSRVMV